MKEIWKDIEGYEGYYQVSNLGRVKSLERVFERFNGHINIRQKVNEKILKPEKTRWGYLRVHLNKGGISKKYVVHRLVAYAFILNPYNLPQVNHKNRYKNRQ